MGWLGSIGVHGSERGLAGRHWVGPALMMLGIIIYGLMLQQQWPGVTPADEGG